MEAALAQMDYAFDALNAAGALNNVNDGRFPRTFLMLRKIRAASRTVSAVSYPSKNPP